MDILGNQLIIGKYYNLGHHEKDQYTGTDKGNYQFEWIKPFNVRIVLIRTPRAIEERPPILITEHDDDTDNEFMDNPYEEGGNGKKNKYRNVTKLSKKSRNKKKSRKTRNPEKLEIKRNPEKLEIKRNPENASNIFCILSYKINNCGD